MSLTTGAGISKLEMCACLTPSGTEAFMDASEGNLSFPKVQMLSGHKGKCTYKKCALQGSGWEEKSVVVATDMNGVNEMLHINKLMQYFPLLRTTELVVPFQAES